MTFRDKTILIACGDKEDRLKFFNYFDEQNAEQIFTATDLAQMHEMLDSEEKYEVLIFEISKDWIQNNRQITKLNVEFPQLKLIGLVSAKIGLSPKHFTQISKQVDELLFSPISQHELVAKSVALNLNEEVIKKGQPVNEKTHSAFFIEQIFQPSSIPQFMIDVNNHQIIQVNEALEKIFSLSTDDLVQKVWHEAVVLKHNDIQKIKAKLTEQGHIKVDLKIDFGSGIKAINININHITIDDQPVYLAEVFDQTDQVFQADYLNYLELITTLDFDDQQQNKAMQAFIKWAGVDFCFVIGKNRSDEFKRILWDCSLNNYAQQFITANHEFLLRKVKANDTYEIDDQAHLTVPGDEFLGFYSINSIIVCESSVDEDNAAVLVAGSIQPPKNWHSIKLLFQQLSLHYKQTTAFKVLQYSHESESQYDVLTGLLNRRYIVKAIEQSIENNESLKAVVFLDLDRFKVINDSLGHDVGDEVLINIAEVLNKHVNGYGVASRYAGDEFLILLDQKITTEKVTSIAQGILESVADPIKLKNGSEINLTVSLGISHYPEHGLTVDKLIKHADVALYDAKLSGKNCYKLFNADLENDHTKQNEEMVKNLKKAIVNDEIDVYFQPKINAATEDIMGFEALIRWDHPELGIISPGLFVPLAEQSDLINDIGMLVIEKSCQRLKQWQDQFNLPLNMSVNLSPVQLSDHELTEKISEIIDQTGIYPTNLDFEITESEKFKSVKDALLMFKKIVNLGCTLSIDDFGTGHSTLDYLRKIPAKTLKIDQVFVKNIGLSPDDEAILDATIDMAKRVGHYIVAEGVETEEQRLYLTQKGCDYFQGYLYCRPVPADEITRILTQRAEILKNN